MKSNYIKNILIFFLLPFFITIIILLVSCQNKSTTETNHDRSEEDILSRPLEIKSEDDIKTYIIKASVIFDEENYSGGIKILTQLKSKDKLSKNRINLLLSLCYLKQNNLNKAPETLNLLTADYLPEYKDFFSLLVLVKKNKYKIWKETKNFCNKYPDSPLASRAYFYAGNIYYKNKRYFEAEFFLNKALSGEKRFNHFPEIYFMLAEIALSRGLPGKALIYYSKIEYLYPFHYLAPLVMENIKSLEKYRWVNNYIPSPEEASTAAHIYEDRLRYSIALEYYREYTDLYPEDALRSGGFYRRALCELTAGSFTDAIDLLNKTIETEGEYAPLARYKLAEIYGSIKKMKEVAALYPGSDTGSKALYNAGFYLEYDGKKSEAMEEYRLMGKLFPDGSWGDAAFWRLGRIYYKGKLYSNACDAFLRATALYPENDWVSDCLYWQAKSAEKLGRKEEAKKIYIKLVDRYDHTYYSYRARAKLISLGYNEYILPETEKKLSFPEGLRLPLKGTFKNKHYENFIELCQLGLFTYGENELILTEFPEDKEKEKIFSYALVLSGQKKYFDAIGLLDKEYNKMVMKGKIDELPLPVIYSNYPLGFWEYIKKESLNREIDPYLISALIREESHYDPSIVSWAEAYGLMQIIPDTGKYIADKINWKFDITFLTDPEKNITMGTYYLAKIQKELYDNEVLSLSGYNGGPGNASYWWSTKYRGDLDEFIEGIPFYETRNYVKRVLKSYWEYKRLYDREQHDYMGRFDR